ncbi:MAG: hypothetical protein HeimC3_30070 [Candidatus Heimdallarchaeota archaeon LC_3]|nr:MAG: hypothetical protein HeimC3_30070 [Candidatus Heimdallarchaeota archaeon LC_3]
MNQVKIEKLVGERLFLKNMTMNYFVAFLLYIITQIILLNSAIIITADTIDVNDQFVLIFILLLGTSTVIFSILLRNIFQFDSSISVITFILFLTVSIDGFLGFIRFYPLGFFLGVVYSISLVIFLLIHSLGNFIDGYFLSKNTTKVSNPIKYDIKFLLLLYLVFNWPFLLFLLI